MGRCLGEWDDNAGESRTILFERVKFFESHNDGSIWRFVEYIFRLPGICCCPSSMSLFARSIPFKYRRGFRERSRVDLQMWGAAMGSYIVNPGAIRCGPKVAQG